MICFLLYIIILVVIISTLSKILGMKKLKSVKYFNNLSKIRNKDGLRIRPEYLLATSKLSDLSENDIKKLETAGIKEIFDFRSKIETKKTPDVKIEGANYHNFALLSDEDSPVITKENRMEILKEKMKYPGGVKGYVCHYYEKLVTSSSSINGYKEALGILKHSDGHIVYHCTQGKDRTGLFTCLLLYILGFSKKTIYKTYMRYNRKMLFQSLKYSLALTIRYFSIRKTHALLHVLLARKTYLDHAIAMILKQYGSIKNFIYKALNFQDLDTVTLKSKFLY